MNTKTTMTKKRILFITAFLALVVFAVCALAACSRKDNSPPANTATYTVSFNTNGGSPVSKQYVKSGGRVEKPADPIKGGKTFDGWCKDAALTDLWQFDVDTVTSDITLHARWLTAGGVVEPGITEYTVTFVTNCAASVSSQTVAVGGKVYEPSPITNGSKVFDGWYKNIGCTEPWDFAVDTVDGPTTLYAAWKDGGAQVVTYTVTYNSNGGSAVASETVRSGGRATQPTAPTKSGKIFGGWFKEPTCVNAWDFSKDTVNGATTLYAKWTDAPVIDPGKKSWTVTFLSNGGSNIPSQTVNEGGKVVKPADPTNSDKVFGGWFKNEDCTEAWNFSVDTVDGNVTLYAKWTNSSVKPIDPSRSTATVTFNVGLDARKAGVYNPAAQTVNVGSLITAPSVKRPNYTISGWKVENGSTKWNFATDKLNTDTTLFAEWTKGSSGGGTDEREDYTVGSNMQNSNTLYIHYKRSDGNYAGWHVWAWNGSETANKWYEPDEKLQDKSGTVIPVPLASSSTSSIMFIVAKGNWEEQSADISLTLGNALKVGSSYHWFVWAGNVENGRPYLQKASAIEPPLQTYEPLRESVGNVDRSTAAAIPTAKTATTCDEMGVGYQIFVASFCDSNGDGMGDIRGIINKLDYLDGLNVDVLWLTPIQSSDSSHGYDCYDYYAIDPKFGTNADYRELVYKAHSKGIKVIMDLVVNHTSQKNEWFIKSKQGVVETVTYQDGTTEKVNFRDVYRWKNKSGNERWRGAGNNWYFYSSFGDSMPELNYDYQPTRNLMTDVATYWMSFGLDGFRLDAIKHLFMWDESNNASGDTHAAQDEAKDDGTGYDFNLTKDVEVFKEFNSKLKAKFPNCFILGEQLSGNEQAVSPFYEGMDSLFDFNTYYNLPKNIVSGDAATQASYLNRNAALYEKYRGDRPINSMITSNHDITRLYNTSVNGDVNKTKLYFAVIMTMPGLSWIYYGDEIGLVGKDIKDDRYQRQSMKWTETWQYKCSNNGIPDYGINGGTKSVATQETDGSSLLNYVRSLTKLRNDYPALISGSATCSAENGMLKITVTKQGESTMVVYHNFSSSQKTVSQSGTVVFGSKTVPAYGTVAIKQ